MFLYFANVPRKLFQSRSKLTGHHSSTAQVDQSPGRWAGHRFNIIARRPSRHECNRKQRSSRIQLTHWCPNRYLSALVQLMGSIYSATRPKIESFLNTQPISTHARFEVNWTKGFFNNHYSDVIMGAMAFQITSLTIVYSTIYSGTDQRKHQSSASLAFERGIHRCPVNSPHKGPVTRKMFPFNDVIMCSETIVRTDVETLTNACRHPTSVAGTKSL